MHSSKQDTGDNEKSDPSEGRPVEGGSSLTQFHESLEDALSSFREQWQKELQFSLPPKQKSCSLNSSVVQKGEDIEIEIEAKTLFMKGVEMEQNGKVYEAIYFYKRAVQLVPDIEFRLENKNKTVRELMALTSSHEKDLSSSESEDEEDGDDEDEKDLLLRIQKKMANVSALCTPKTEQRLTHISALPMEMILYILRWVVSSDLDLRSLEMFSLVCRGFYLCARDPDIWRLACLRVWGLNCGGSPYNYLSWRDMYIERTRLHFNGCYIGKTTYIRHGENSFQDQFYRPWHLVAYYRYLRFFPEGVVLVLTSSDEPTQCVSLMKNRNARSPILRGYYKLIDDKITLVVTRQEKQIQTPNFRRPKRRGENNRETAEQTFHMELQIKSTNKKKHVQLVWTHYSVYTRTPKGDESTCNFDLVANRFPPFWFSRVKSYTLESENPLQ